MKILTIVSAKVRIVRQDTCESKNDANIKLFLQLFFDMLPMIHYMLCCSIEPKSSYFED